MYHIVLGYSFHEVSDLWNPGGTPEKWSKLTDAHSVGTIQNGEPGVHGPIGHTDGR